MSSSLLVVFLAVAVEREYKKRDSLRVSKKFKAVAPTAMEREGGKKGEKKKSVNWGAPPKIFVEMTSCERNCTRREPVAKLAKPGPPVSDLGGRAASGPKAFSR